jgi:hypothetical protein
MNLTSTFKPSCCEILFSALPLRLPLPALVAFFAVSFLPHHCSLLAAAGVVVRR